MKDLKPYNIYDLKFCLLIWGVFMAHASTDMNLYNSQKENIIDYSLIRSMLRSIGSQHWSVLKAMDEYDIPEDKRDIYMDTIADEFFVS